MLPGTASADAERGLMYRLIGIVIFAVHLAPSFQ
jgi:hypothetical protein